MRFEIVEGGFPGAPNYRVRLVADNNETVWWTEHYSSLENAEGAIRLLAQMFHANASIMDTTMAFVVERHPAPITTIEVRRVAE